MEQFEDTGRSPIKGQSQVNRLHLLMEFAMDNFRKSFAGNRRAVEHMLSQGMSSHVLEIFKVGYAVDAWDALKNAAHKTDKKYHYSELEKAGLLNYSRKKQDYYDVFRGRVMIPFLHHITGQCIGFVGRIVQSSNSDLPKDLYPRDIALFKLKDKIKIFTKESYLFGLFQAGDSIKKQGEVYVVSHYMDVLRLVKFGVTNVVSSSGIPFTRKQALLLKRFTSKVIIVIDGRNPGLKAAEQRVDVFLSVELKVEVVILQRNLKEEQEFDALRSELRSSRLDYIIFKASNILEGKENLVSREKVIKSLVRTISYIPSQSLRELYIGECATLGGFPLQTLQRELAKIDFRRKEDLEKRAKGNRLPKNSG